MGNYDLQAADEKLDSMDTTERLRYLILAGKYEPGQRLREDELADDLAVSRTPVRQALMKLEAEGMVEIVPRRGATVCNFSVDEVWHIYDLRAVLEGHAARRAAGRIQDRELDNMREAIEAFEQYEFNDQAQEQQVRWLVKCNQEFHGSVVAASGNPKLELLLQRTVEVPLLFKAVAWYTPYERSIANYQHQQILWALEAADGERAEILMREHVYEGRDRVIRALEEKRVR